MSSGGRAVPELRPARTLVAVGLAAMAAAGTAALPLAADAAVPSSSPTKACTITDPRLPGIAAMAASGRHPGVLWVHSTERYSPKIFALDTTTCAIRATLTLKDASGREITGLAMSRDGAGRPTIMVGDVGDSLESRPYLRIHEVVEPRALVDRTVSVRTWRVKFADGARNVQTLLATPKGPTLWLVAAASLGGRVFSVPPLPDLADGETDSTPLVAKPVGLVPGLVTDGSVSPSGLRTVVRTAKDAHLYGPPPPKGAGSRLPIPTEPAGQAISWAADGTFLWAAGAREKVVWKVPLPAAAPVPGVSPSARPSGSPSAAAGEGLSPKRVLLAAVAVLAGVGVAVAASWRFRV
jgi:hypothetical protein